MPANQRKDRNRVGGGEARGRAVAGTRCPAEAVPKPPAPPKPVEPADARQLTGVLDLRRLPAPETSTVGGTSATKLQALRQSPSPAAVNFYRGKLEQLGWKPAARSCPRTSRGRSRLKRRTMTWSSSASKLQAIRSHR